MHILPTAQVHSQISHDKDNKRSIDWIVVCPKAVLLVEVKSVRRTEPVRLGSAEALTEITRLLGYAYEQIDRTDALIAAAHPSFAHVPANLLFTAATAAAVAGPKPSAHSVRHRRDDAGTRPRL